jgi:small subunit ribosomal protein S9
VSTPETPEEDLNAVSTPETPAEGISDEPEAAVEETVDATDDVATDDVAADDVATDEVVEDSAEEPAEVAVDIAPVESSAVFSDRPIQTVGRRKEAVVRVRLLPGSGKFTLNGKTLEDYFPNKLHQQLIREPLVTVEKTERFDIFANLHGGGTSGQAGALRLAIARALIEADSEDRPPLKRAGFLTRDPRVIERKKYGLKKARKAPQYSKR